MKKDNTLTIDRENELRMARHTIGLYSIRELCSMFECSRPKIDNAVNSGKLKYISPNNRDRFVYLDDYLNYLKEQEICK